MAGPSGVVPSLQSARQVCSVIARSLVPLRLETEAFGEGGAFRGCVGGGGGGGRGALLEGFGAPWFQWGGWVALWGNWSILGYV